VASPVLPSSGALRPIDDVRLEGGFWGDRQRLNAEKIIRHCYAWESRLGWIDNFRDPHTERGREFADSDVYKMVEAMAWEVGRSGDEELDRLIGEIAEAASGAQEDDGYLNTRFGHRGHERRYTDLEWGHELYCYGHMIQAAVARLRTRGEDRFTEITRRAADHVCDAFGDDGNQGVCGHPEIEMALVELYRATGDVRYADQIERTLYNVIATSPALDGSGFFYANPLHQRVPGEAPDPDAESPRAASSLRAPWFHVSCCPTNVARTFASLAGYVATAADRGVQLHQLVPCTVRTGRSRCVSRRATRGRARSSCASRRPATSRGGSPCACRRGRARPCSSTAGAAVRWDPATRPWTRRGG
jgi:DUF1680 family protein